MRAMVAKSSLGLSAITLLMTLPVAAPAQSTGKAGAEPIRYTLSFPAPHTHYLEITASVPTGGRPQVELMMAVWSPGSYLVREFSRHVEAFTARGPDGRTLDVDRSRKNRWTITTGGAPTVTIAYRVYSREMGVRTSWVESRLAILNGAPTFISLAESASRIHEVTLALPQDWKRVMTGLQAMSGRPHVFSAPDFDTLVDSPIVAGSPEVHEFTVDGKRHYLVNTPATDTFDGARAAKNLARRVQQQRRMWWSPRHD